MQVCATRKVDKFLDHLHIQTSKEAKWLGEELPGKTTEKKGAIAHQPLMVAAAKVEKLKWMKLTLRADHNGHEQSKSRALEAAQPDTVGNDKQRIPHHRPIEHSDLLLFSARRRDPSTKP